METEQAVSAKKHISILQQRVDNLEKELKRVQIEKDSVEATIKEWENIKISQESQFSERLNEIENKFKRDEAAISKQIALTRIVVDKKKEERDALIGALKQTTFLDYLDDDLNKVDWNTLKFKALNVKKTKTNQGLSAKADTFKQLVEKARLNMKDMLELRDSVLNLKNKFEDIHKQFREKNAVASTKCLERGPDSEI